MLLCNDAVVHRGLNIPAVINRARPDRVLPGTGLRPVERPDLPGKLGLLAMIDGRRRPCSVVDLDLHLCDRCAPGGADDSVVVAETSDPCRGRLQPGAADRS